MNGGPSGFGNAPVTKSFLVLSGILSVLSGIQGRAHHLGLSYKDIFEKQKLWKSTLSIFSFSSTPELIFGIYLLYYFRVFERQIGSNKYSVFILFSILISFLGQVLVLGLLKDASLKLNSGPYGLIFSSFVPFYLDIPISTRIRVFSLQFSDKSFIYLAGLQLLLSSWRRSVIPGICGLLAGSLYRLNVLYIRKAKVPGCISLFFTRLRWPSIRSISLPASTRNIAGNMPYFSSPTAQPNYPPPGVLSTSGSLEASVAMLVSMGFDHDSARQALLHARNDVNQATNILLEAQAHQ
ncbi:hypothetical protein MLD38_004496 [Melastoma candidum]|uniref:Uncharacterized protein n=1 Tax=Melastoma candidum TaxID=119954 RepID=A0ACB9S6A6_9MYRT|nr:hypothetical protein MLD38_004496 [Melastoma candidum]